MGDYAYDVYDQRIGKTTATGTERFVYGQNQNIALEFDGSGALTNRYLHGDGIDAIIADEANGSVGWTLTDNLGTVRDVVDGTGASKNHFVYDSFGNVTSETNPSFDTRFTFTGREFDAETGNYDYRNRQLSPSNGRFIEEDPLSFAGDSWNLYSYVGNLSTGFTDPEGYRRRPAQPLDYLRKNRPPSNLPQGGRGFSRYIDYGIGVYNPYQYLPAYQGLTPVPLKPGNTPQYRLPLSLVEQLLKTVRNSRSVDPLYPFINHSQNENLADSLRRSFQLNNPELFVPQQVTDENDIASTIPPAEIPTPDAPDPQCTRDCIPLTSPPVLGGEYLDVRTKTTGRRDVHHMPSWQATANSAIGLGRLGNGGRNMAPGICMSRDDHQDTASYGGGPTSRNARFRAQETTLINQGGYDLAQIMGIADVRSKFPSKYDFGIIQMINYTRRLQAEQPLLF